MKIPNIIRTASIPNYSQIVYTDIACISDCSMRLAAVSNSERGRDMAKMKEKAQFTRQ